MDTVALALACHRNPLAYRDRLALGASLPADMECLLRIANGSAETTEKAVQRLGANPLELRDAAKFCVQQWCFARGADHYRVLGLEPGASLDQIKEHYRLLMQLFHPDRTAGRETWTEHYATRVNEAWAALSRSQIPAVSDLSPAPSSTLKAFGDFNSSTRPTPSNENLRRMSPFHRSRSRFRRPRQRLPKLILGSLALVTSLVLGGIYLVKPPTNQTESGSANAVVTGRSIGTSAIPKPPIDVMTDRSAIVALLATPDWQMLERHERSAGQAPTQAHEAYWRFEQDHRERMVTEEALLESRTERGHLGKQIKNEQARIEHAKTGRQRLDTPQVGQPQLEQIKDERPTTAQEQMEGPQAEGSNAKRLVDESKTEGTRQEQPETQQERAEWQWRLEQQATAEPIRTVEQARLEIPAARTSIAPMSENHPTLLELKYLLNQYVRAYERNDLNNMMLLFSTDARGKGGSSRNDIHQAYATLFTTHRVRQLRLQDLRWTYHDAFAKGSGRYELRLQRRDSGESIQLKGSIHFKMRKKNRQVLIEAIDYDWPIH